MGSAFLGGAAGSAIAGALPGSYGWTGATLFGASIGLLAFLLWAWIQLRDRSQLRDRAQPRDPGQPRDRSQR